MNTCKTCKHFKPFIKQHFIINEEGKKKLKDFPGKEGTCENNKVLDLIWTEETYFNENFGCIFWEGL